MITGRHQPNDKLEQDSQGAIFNLCDADMHDLRRLKRSAPSLDPSTRSRNSSSAQEAPSFQTHNEHQHKGCRRAGGNKRALDSATRTCAFTGDFTDCRSNAYHKRGMSNMRLLVFDTRLMHVECLVLMRGCTIWQRMRH